MIPEFLFDDMSNANNAQSPDQFNSNKSSIIDGYEHSMIIYYSWLF